MREPMTVWFTRYGYLRTDPSQLSAPYRDTTVPGAVRPTGGAGRAHPGAARRAGRAAAGAAPTGGAPLRPARSTTRRWRATPAWTRPSSGTCWRPTPRAPDGLRGW